MKKRLKRKTTKVTTLKETQYAEMFKLFETSYDNVTYEGFCRDLKQKTDIILLIDSHHKIQGFSTLMDFPLKLNGKSYRIVYSGDTIISTEYRGTTALVDAFASHIMKVRFKHPHQETWWFLLTKGYKTYLLLTKNFLTYYPRPNVPMPAKYEELRMHLAERFYPKKFVKSSGVLQFEPGEHEKLKDNVAPITEELLQKYPDIKFFHDLNPNWKNGNELVCLGRIEAKLSIYMPTRNLIKRLMRKRKKHA